MHNSINPFSNKSALSYDDESVMSAGARALVGDFQRAELSAARQALVDAAEHILTRQKADIGHAKRAAEQIKEVFLATEGADLFERDPATNQVLKTPDGAYIPKLSAELDSLRSRAKGTVGLIEGALTSKVHGEQTTDAIAAAKELAERDPIYKAKMDKWSRIKDRIDRITQAEDAIEMKLGHVATQRLAAAGIIFGTRAPGLPPS